MRWWVTLVLIAAQAYCQYSLWLSEGNYHEMSGLAQQFAAQEEKNRELALRNLALAAEVQDLAEGHEAIGEIARYELGYIENGETFYRIRSPENAQ